MYYYVLRFSSLFTVSIRISDEKGCVIEEKGRRRSVNDIGQIVFGQEEVGVVTTMKRATSNFEETFVVKEPAKRKFFAARAKLATGCVS